MLASHTNCYNHYYQTSFITHPCEQLYGTCTFFLYNQTTISSIQTQKAEHNFKTITEWNYEQHEQQNKQIARNKYNPRLLLDLSLKADKFFVIKSYSEYDIRCSIKYNVWCSTKYGNRRLDAAFRGKLDNGRVFLFFSVNSSRQFCGMAEMLSCVDYNSKFDLWSEDKWQGKFEVKWLYIKNVPNRELRHICLENNENNPITKSRDAQEIQNEIGKQVWSVIHYYKHSTSISD
jgi:hypothetical protein